MASRRDGNPHDAPGQPHGGASVGQPPVSHGYRGRFARKQGRTMQATVMRRSAEPSAMAMAISWTVYRSSTTWPTTSSKSSSHRRQLPVRFVETGHELDPRPWAVFSIHGWPLTSGIGSWRWEPKRKASVTKGPRSIRGPGVAATIVDNVGQKEAF